MKLVSRIPPLRMPVENPAVLTLLDKQNRVNFRQYSGVVVSFRQWRQRHYAAGFVPDPQLYKRGEDIKMCGIE